jgi:hypothetical protein
MFHPIWIVLMVLGFIAWWPLGLVVLGAIIGSGRMGCWSHGSNHWQNKMDRMQEKMDRVRDKMDRMRGGGNWWGTPPSSGNRAFDDYRAETLRRLEEEQREFRDFLDRLRFAKDKTEFDAFMAERRNRSQGTGPQGPADHPVS